MTRPGWSRRDFMRHFGAMTALGASGALHPNRWPAEPPSGPLSEVRVPAGVVPRATEAADLSLAEAATLLDRGDLSAVELAEACLARAAQFDSTLQAFNHHDPEALLAAARAADARGIFGGLNGIPLAIKDNFYTAGIRTTANSHIFADFVPEWDAEAWRRLKGRGGLLAGKTQMGPLATSRATTPDGEITTLNAWAAGDPEVSPGGSSSGSGTAVAAGMALAGTGTQTGGSITNPSLAQGLTGLKPTMGRVSLRGIIPLTYTRDHPGPIARSAIDAAILLQAMAGEDPGDPRTLGLPRAGDYVTAATPVRRRGETVLRQPLRIGVMPGALDEDPQRPGQPEPGARRAFLEHMADLGAEIVEVPAPADWETLTSSEFNNARLPERAEPFLAELQRDVRLFGVTLTSWINGLLLPGVEYLHGQRARLLLLQRLLDETFAQCDVVLQTSPIPFDMTGLPLIAFPVGMHEDDGLRLPHGVLLGAPPCEETRLLMVAAAWQDSTEWHLERPAFGAASSGAGGSNSSRVLDVLEVEAQSQ